LEFSGLRKASFFVALVDVLDRGDIGGGSDVESQTIFVGSFHDLHSRSLHGESEARMNDILLSSSVDSFFQVSRGGHCLADRIADRLEDSHVLVASEFPCESTVRDVVQVLEPFKVGNGDTASVEVKIGDDKALVLDEYFMSKGSHWTVSTFSDDLGFDATSIVSGDDLLFSASSKNIAFDFDEAAFFGFVPSSGTRKAGDASGLHLVLVQSVDVDAVLVEKTSVPLDDTDAFRTLTKDMLKLKQYF